MRSVGYDLAIGMIRRFRGGFGFRPRLLMHDRAYGGGFRMSTGVDASFSDLLFCFLTDQGLPGAPGTDLAGHFPVWE